MKSLACLTPVHSDGRPVLVLNGPCQTENMKRTFGYKPFVKELIGHCQEEGRFAPLLNRRKQQVGAR